tara:strand:- start:242 stop:631 length:390 start_codon:yes stop_codon:yes gene_type:complete
MTAIYPKEICYMCGNYLDDDMKCYECEDCNGEKMTDTITLTTDTTFDHTKFTGEYDPVNKPPHYTLDDGIECIDYMRQVLGLQGFIDLCHGNLIKYQHRYKYKGKPVQDMEKAQYYLNKMVDALKEKHK